MFALIITFLGNLFFLAGYIVNPNAFPKALDSETEKRYIEEYLAGDRSKRDLLIEHNLRLVVHVVKKYITSGKDMDDLISIGTIGLIKAIDSYKNSKSTRLATYAARCIENEVLMVLRAEKKLRNEVSLYEPIKNGKGSGDMTYMDILETESEEVYGETELRFDIEKLRLLINRILFGREKTIIELRYGLKDGRQWPQREVADVLDISRSYVSRIEKRAVEKLREAFDESEIKRI